MDKSFEFLLKKIVNEEFTYFIDTLTKNVDVLPNKYLTIKEVSKITGIGTYTLRQLTYARAMPHRKIKARLLFEEREIKETISDYKKFGWTDPENCWDVHLVRNEIMHFERNKGGNKMIEDILREIIRDELNNFSKDIKKHTNKEKTSYYGRTVLTIKEAAAHFRTSPSTIYNLIKEDGMPHFKIQSRFYIVLEEAEAYLWRETAKSYTIEGNIYWQRILQRLEWEEKEREIAYEKALKRLEELK
jgi:predicted DNA-binding transcriptional regulator AlpA